MKKLILILFAVSYSIISCSGETKFPLSQLNSELEVSKNPKILVFMPSISDSTEYASMIVQAFQNYFVRKLAFDPHDRDKVNIDVILVTEKNSLPFAHKEKDRKQIVLSSGLLSKADILNNLFDTTNMHLVSVNKSTLEKLEIPSFADYDNSSVLILLDGDNNIVWRDDNYRGQGEHLKPLEYKIKGLLGITYPKPTGDSKEIKIGEKVSDEFLSENGMVFSGIKVLTFYPAAYSGVFDVDNIVRKAEMNHLSMISCAMHISSFDKMLLGVGGVDYYAISESTPEILDNWRAALGTYHIQYVNDADYSISQAFGAYNPEGYNNRVTVVIDKEGKVAYIDKDYKLEKEAEIQRVVQELLQKDKK